MMQSRTHTCGAASAGRCRRKASRFAGWMENVRVVGANLAFVVLRDFYGTTQVVIETEDMMNIIKSINKESTISGRPASCASATARIRSRPTGDIEVVPEQIDVLGKLPLQRAAV